MRVMELRMYNDTLFGLESLRCQVLNSGPLPGR